jgi:Raf kinase inhibitor-like YbhB/YbcL family protein
MKLWSDSWVNGERIPVRYAAGRLDTPEGVTFADNLSPHLAWSDLPVGTRSLALICHDFDVPSRGDDVNQAGREIPADLPRVDFGKPGPAVAAPGFTMARQGINDYTGWFAGDPAMAGDYYGYDGPFPPWNDSLIHHYVFTLYALDVARTPIEGRFAGAALRQAIYPHVLGAATHSGTYTLNRRLL